MTEQQGSHLKQALKPIHLWAIAVGLVISGEYFGWNYGWQYAGAVGFLITTALVTVMYVTFIFSYTELTTAIPHAGGAFAYAYKALGPLGGLIAGFAALVEFLFATPGIAFALGSYLHFLYPGIPIITSAIVFNVIFILLNISGIKESAAFSVFITLLAVLELLLYMGIVAPSFSTENFVANAMPLNWAGVIAALPFAIWFYLAIEGVAQVAEEVKQPKVNIPKGYITAMLTLVLLALGVMILTGGITDWRKLSNLDYPLPEAIGIVLGKGSSLTKVFASIGLFGLIASFHGTILASSRQVFAMARSGYLPSGLAQVSNRFKTPHWSIIAGGMVSVTALLTGTTSQIIILSVMGAVLMYIMSMISLFILRKKEPQLDRPFKAPVYPIFPGIALMMAIVSLVTIVYFNPLIGVTFFAGLMAAVLLFFAMGKHKDQILGDVMLENKSA